MSETAGTRCVVYCRISKDVAGDELGVARQEADCRTLCEQLGLEVVEVFTDDDRSAYTGKPRPSYVRMLDRLAGGDITTVVAWHPDRLNRHPRELEDLIDFLEANRISVHTVRAGLYDLSTPTGRMTARVVGAVARHESEHKSDRLQAKARQTAEQGRVSGGGGRPFGFEPDRITIREPEADLLRQAAGWVLDEVPLGEICRRLDRTGISPVGGGGWRTVKIRRALLRPRVAGLREHRGTVVGKAVWPAIIDEPTWRAVCATLSAPGRRMNTHPRPYLLTGGIARCGECGGILIARPSAGGVRAYVCPPVGEVHGRPGCGAIRRRADDVETETVARLFAVIAELPTIEPVADVDQLAVAAEIARLDEAMAGLARDHYAHGLIGRSEYLAARDALDSQLETTRARLTTRPRRRASVPADLVDQWPTMEHEERRQTITDWIDAVVIHRALKGRNTFDPTKIEIRWRT